MTLLQNGLRHGLSTGMRPGGTGSPSVFGMPVVEEKSTGRASSTRNFPPGSWSRAFIPSALLLTALLGGLLVETALAQPAASRRLDLSAKEIDYYGEETDDAFARLMQQVKRGDLALESHPVQGYLPALLKALDIPVESQLLIFSKTSLQAGYISPSNPRALYFNDEITLGWIPGAPIIELMAQDPVKGTMFYSIPQKAEHFEARRDQRCNGCHATSRSAYVPGYLLRSFETTDRGGPVSGRAKITQETPVELRWGGWYITGETPHQPHRGNLRGSEDYTRHRDEPLFRGAVTDLSPLVDLKDYPIGTSDVAAAMVMDHFADTYNLLVRAGLEQRLGETVTVKDDLVTALLQLNEAPLQGPVRGTDAFISAYRRLGAAPAEGPSLRDLDLQQRVFKWHVSPMVLTRSFQQLPAPLKSELMATITSYLDGVTPWPSDRVAPSTHERQTALRLLRQALPDWPASAAAVSAVP